MTKLEAIINKAQTKPQKMVKCRRCKGTGEWQLGRTCYSCSHGLVPNKWMALETSARELQSMIKITAAEFDGWVEGRDEKYIAERRADYQQRIDVLAKRAGI